MKRKIISLSVIAILILSLIGCGQDKKVATQQLETNKVDTTKDEDSGQTKGKAENEPSKTTQTEANKNGNLDSEKDNGKNVIPKTNNKTSDVNVQKQAKANVFTNEQPIFNDGCVNINPSKVYYNGNSLVVEAYVTNALDSTIFNIQVDNFILANKSGVIASDAFGTMKGASIGPHQFIKWTFKFAADSIKKQNADLSYLEYRSNTRYNF